MTIHKSRATARLRSKDSCAAIICSSRCPTAPTPTISKARAAAAISPEPSNRDPQVSAAPGPRVPTESSTAILDRIPLEPRGCTRNPLDTTWPANVSREKLLFYAAAGGLGGLAAWGAAEPFMGIHSIYGRDIILGALVGAFIAAFLASIEALSVSQNRLALRGIRTGGMIGAIGGAVGLIVAELGLRCDARLFRPHPRMGGARHRGRPRRRMGDPLERATAQWRARRRGRRRTRRPVLSKPHHDLSAGVRPRHRDHHTRRADRLLHRTRQRTAQARMADGGAQPEPQRARGPRVSARQAGHDHRTRRGMRRRACSATRACSAIMRSSGSRARTTPSRPPAAAR